jgi:hypothetical protein
MRRLGGVSHHAFRPANARLLEQQIAWHMLATRQAISHLHRRGPRKDPVNSLQLVCRFSVTPTTPALRAWRLVAQVKAKADEDGRGQHVPKDLYVVRSHLLSPLSRLSVLNFPYSFSSLLEALVGPAEEAGEDRRGQ